MEETFIELFKKLEKGIDWQKIYKVMKFLDWHWDLDNNNNYGIPRIDTIKKAVLDLSKKAFDGKTTISTGGFTAGYDVSGNDLWLKFTIEEVYSSEL